MSSEPGSWADVIFGEYYSTECFIILITN